MPQGNGKSKAIFWDAINRCYRTCTSESNTKKIKAIMRGSSMRLNNIELRDRFDSKNNAWIGYKEYNI